MVRFDLQDAMVFMVVRVYILHNQCFVLFRPLGPGDVRCDAGAFIRTG